MGLPERRNQKNQFICKAAINAQETSELIKKDFDFVCEFDDVKLLSKHK
jgi:hypothetical protein